MQNQVCTIEQMKALKELGVDISKASMCYVLDDKDSIDNLTFKINKYSPSTIKEYPDLVFPVFTVTDMLDMMPKCIDAHYIELIIGNSYGYCCGYRDWETDRKSTRLNSSHSAKSRMPSSA